MSDLSAAAIFAIAAAAFWLFRRQLIAWHWLDPDDSGEPPKKRSANARFHWGFLFAACLLGSAVLLVIHLAREVA